MIAPASIRDIPLSARTCGASINILTLSDRSWRPCPAVRPHLRCVCPRHYARWVVLQWAAALSCRLAAAVMVSHPHACLIAPQVALLLGLLRGMLGLLIAAKISVSTWEPAGVGLPTVEGEVCGACTCRRGGRLLDQGRLVDGLGT